MINQWLLLTLPDAAASNAAMSIVSLSRRCMLAVALAAGARPVAAGEVEVRRADEIVLPDGRIVRLASIVVPDRPAEADRRGRAMVAAALAQGSGDPKVIAGRTDRYGRVIARLDDGGGRDLRPVLLAAGLAVVRVGDEPSADLAPLLEAEAGARDAGLGLWGEIDQCAATPATVGERIGRFARVEGRVVAASVRADHAYLDFGADWRRDFGVRIRRADLAELVAAGVDPAGLAGVEVVVRGWPFEATGPMIEVRDPVELQRVR